MPPSFPLILPRADGTVFALDAAIFERGISAAKEIPRRRIIMQLHRSDGYTKDADNVGGYNQDVKGWVQVDTNIFPGALINGVSIPGGTQRIITIKYQLYQGNWWFQVQGVWMGSARISRT